MNDESNHLNNTIMAKVTGVVQIKGTLGDLCFYKSKDGYILRRKSSVSKQRIKNDPAFARTRENMAEFTSAATASKLFRRAFRPLFQRACDKGVSRRLMRLMSHVIKTDDVHGRGLRNVNDGEAQLFEGFECNENRRLGSSLLAPFSASIDRASGKMIIVIPAFSVSGGLSYPPGATHFRFFAGGAAIDFENDTYDVARSESSCLAISRDETPVIELIQEVKLAAQGHFFLLLGIEFLQVVNGAEFPLVGQSALAVVRVAPYRRAG
jgi:hypothetical protein